MELEIQAFFFNAKTDYLPYYKNFSIEIDASSPIVDILPMIKEKNRDFNYPKERLYFRLNGLVLDGSQSVGEVTDRLGRSLQLDPLSAYRAENGLLINDDDFEQSFEILARYATSEDRAYYDTLYPLHYASETFAYDNHYIGDAILLLASKMISNSSDNKGEILHAIGYHNHGLWECEYENNLYDKQEHSREIEELKKVANHRPEKSISQRLSSTFARRYKDREIGSLDGKRVAYYAGSSVSSDSLVALRSKITDKGATVVRFAQESMRAGQSMLETNSDMAYMKAGRMMLDAIDSGAELLIFSRDDEMGLFGDRLGSIEKAVGREINIDMIPYSKLMEL